MRNYSFARIAGVHYQRAFEHFNATNPGASELPYAELQARFFHNCYVYGDGISHGMREIGHQAFELVYDYFDLQKNWASEHSYQVKKESRENQIFTLLKQIEQLRPEVVFFQDIYALPYAIRATLKERFPFIKLTVIYRGYPGIDEHLFKELSTADLVLCGSPILREALAENGMQAHLIYHSFDKRVLARLGQDFDPSPAHDFVFAGATGFGRGLAQQDRYWFLKRLLDQTDLMIWGEELDKDLPKRNLKDNLRRLRRMGKRELAETLTRAGTRRMRRLAEMAAAGLGIKGANLAGALSPEGSEPVLPLAGLFPERVKDPVFGLELFRLFQGSKLTLNRHTDAARKGGYVDNMRLFQATGAGGCLLTDGGRNLSDLFEPDKEVVVYSSFEECLEKVEYLLGHEKERQEIARKAQERTLAEHEVCLRCQEIDELIQKKLSTQGKPAVSKPAKKPTLSVVMANYNHARYLPVALDAILAQSYQPLEIIVFDDCSKDESMQILEKYAAKHPHLRVVRNEPNRGVFYIMNQGLEQAKGDFIYFAASDDKALPGFFEKTMTLLERFPDAGLCTGLQRLMDEQGNDLGIADTPCVADYPAYLRPDVTRDLMYEHGYWAMGVPCIWNKRATLEAGGYCYELRSQLDVFTAQVVALRNGACFIPEPLSQWRLRTDSFTNSSNSDLQLQLMIAGKTLELMRGKHSDVFPPDYVAKYEYQQYSVLHSGLINSLYQTQLEAVNEYFKENVNDQRFLNNALYKTVSGLLRMQKFILKAHSRLRRHNRRGPVWDFARKARNFLRG